MNNLDLKHDVNIDILDIAKLVLSFFIVALHTELLPSVLFPWLRIAVPLFFIISSFLFFSKLYNANIVEQNNVYKRFVKRNMRLYGIWFTILLPFTVYVRKGWFAEGFAKGVFYSLRGLIFGSTFRASWFIMALVISVSIIYYSSKTISNKAIIIISSIMYAICCLLSNYYTVIKASSLSFLCSISDMVFGGVSESFLSALFWIAIGKVFAEKGCDCINKKRASICVVICSIFLFLEYKILDKYVKPTVNDNYFSLMFLCPCIFALLISLSNRKYRWAFFARKCSTITYMVHCEIAMCVRFALRFLGVSSSFLLFAITSVICVITSYCLLRLSETNRYRFLKNLM